MQVRHVLSSFRLEGDVLRWKVVSTYELQLIDPSDAFGPQLSGLTVRMRQVAEGILKGRQNKEIAVELGISVRTVKFHVSSLLLRYHCSDRKQLAALLISLGGDKV